MYSQMLRMDEEKGIDGDIPGRRRGMAFTYFIVLLDVPTPDSHRPDILRDCIRRV